MRIFRAIAAAGLAVSALAMGASSSAAAEYPERNVTMYVAYSPGGGTDVMARTLIPYLEKYLPGDGSIVVENKPGAGGEIGFTAIATAENDGYSIGMINVPAVVTPLIQRTPGYDLDSFETLGNVVSDPGTIVVREDSEFQTLDDLVTYVRENPGSLPIGNSAIGGSTHTALLRFLGMADLEVTHVPFPGSAPSRTALLGGHVAASIMGLGEAGPYHQEGKLRILGTMASERWDEVPEAPTFKELGYDIVAGSDRGLVAPAGIPEDAATALAEAVRQAVADPEFQEEARKQLLPLNYLPPKEHREHLAETLTKMEEVWERTPWGK
ncbi:tripartite tricarboxylate transporter substrate binding protein [Aurantimonas coralicida]|uniref:tripartite tricarboxylate transporter substrate binding protein n=1 Tax=Aurantimonas coralicida TaxID=182270 RepID=UPI001E2DCDD6|nr:tripartite tricarboxylate transporter substrate binding protein [Aurantimonas coralicida]MCD1644714.1 tripartite tricarboxylate transporter substrate binding protein [Aurantimonas coralicida]MCW7543602.1 tripartite tricarboxylate transporter substrate binding protein [Aurantimonas litoralis]MDX1731247.1 tripartite tricarboxylate transporter substrate binding protein [Aurantimonas coralicida]